MSVSCKKLGMIKEVGLFNFHSHFSQLDLEIKLSDFRFFWHRNLFIITDAFNLPY